MLYNIDWLISFNTNRSDRLSVSIALFATSFIMCDLIIKFTDCSILSLKIF